VVVIAGAYPWLNSRGPIETLPPIANPESRSCSPYPWLNSRGPIET